MFPLKRIFLILQPLTTYIIYFDELWEKIIECKDGEVGYDWFEEEIKQVNKSVKEKCLWI